jgi:hypothetical protein
VERLFALPMALCYARCYDPWEAEASLGPAWQSWLYRRDVSRLYRSSEENNPAKSDYLNDARYDDRKR